MIIRQGGGNAGIIEYLEHGMKSGREFTRDELDDRFIIDGNINQLKRTIDLIENKGQERYLHITLSFDESNISKETLTNISDFYKETLMSAYDYDEFNFYSEAHLPKIQKIENKKTGDLIERKPHIHIIIPKINLITNKATNPTETYLKDLKFHEAIQEKINYKFKLISPFEKPRSDPISKADILSREKADIFNGKQSEFKRLLISKIESREIDSMVSFTKELKKYGDIRERNKGKDNSYYAIKLNGDKKFTNLKSPLFNEKFITTGDLKRVRPTEKQTDDRIEKWVNTYSLINKYIVKSSPKQRKEFYSATPKKQQEILNERHTTNSRRNRDARNVSVNGKLDRQRGTGISRHTTSSIIRGNGESTGRTNDSTSINIKSNRQQKSIELYINKFASSRIKQLSEIPNSLPSLPQRPLVNDASGEQSRKNRTKMLLPLDASYDLAQPINRDSENLRWRTDRRNSRVITHAETLQTDNNSLRLFKDIRLNLNPKHLLPLLEKPFNLDTTNYKYFKTKSDGSYRIRSDNLNLNVSDFLTKKLNLSFEEAKPFLIKAFDIQKEYNHNVANKNESNQIIFESNIYEKLFNSNIDSDEYFYRLGNMAYTKIVRENEMKSLRDLASKVKINDINNQILKNDDELTPKKLFDQNKAQQKFDNNLQFTNLIKDANQKNKTIKYTDKNGEVAFIDKGDRLSLGSKPEEKQIELALQLAVEKYGSVKLTGSNEFKDSVLEIAAKNDLKIIFNPKSMHDKFLDIKQALSIPEKEVDTLKEPLSEFNNDILNSDINKLKQPQQQFDEQPQQQFDEQPQQQFDEQPQQQFDDLILQANNKMDKALKVEDFNMDLSSDLENEAISLAQKAAKVAFEAGLLAEKTNNPFENEMLNRQFDKEMYDITSGTNDFDYPPFEQEQLKITYQYDDKNKSYSMLVNNQQVKDILNDTQLETIKENDPYLSNFSNDDIKNGFMPISVSQNEMPTPKTLDSQTLQNLEQQQENKNKNLSM